MCHRGIDSLCKWAPKHKGWTHSRMLSEVNIVKLPRGARRTWQVLNKRFPGHGISFVGLWTTIVLYTRRTA